MKVLKSLTLVTLFLFAISFSASALDDSLTESQKKEIKEFKKSKKKQWKQKKKGKGKKGSVGAPLDGGLLTILGAAGVTYYVSRKKKKNGETE